MVCRMQRNVEPDLRVRRKALEAELDKLGLASRAAQARHVGVSKWHLSRLLSQTTAETPGGSVIARMLVAFPEASFYELFEVVDGRTGRPVRAAKAAA